MELGFGTRLGLRTLTPTLTLVLTLPLTPNEAAEAFGVVSTRTFGSTKAALGFATKLKRRANVGAAPTLTLSLTLSLTSNPNL